MRPVLRTIPLLVFFLAACSAAPPTTQASFPFPTTAVPDPKLISTVGTPHIDQGPDGAVTAAPPDMQSCAYQWAYQDLPVLSAMLEQALQTLQPEARARAFAFGENCVLPDGTVAGFLPMETDFNVTLQVEDLNDDEALGEWLVAAIQVIAELPPDGIVGPQPGRVTLTFQSAGEEQVVTFYTSQYDGLPAGLSPAEIFRQIKSPQ